MTFNQRINIIIELGLCTLLGWVLANIGLIYMGVSVEFVRFMFFKMWIIPIVYWWIICIPAAIVRFDQPEKDRK